jgi:CheY-like chemotaxis protein
MSRRRVETVFVVDDNGIVLSVTAAMLDRQGYRVITSISGKQAVELLGEWTDVEIDLALIDIVLGDMNGTDVAKEITPKWRQLRRIHRQEFKGVSRFSILTLLQAGLDGPADASVLRSG